VQQVNKTVTEMDKAVQQNASAVQQAAAAAAAMRREAESLLGAVGAFRVQRDLPEEAAETEIRGAAPRAAPAPMSTLPAATPGPRQAALAAAGDEWEEF
jgi:hypothetical protein